MQPHPNQPLIMDNSVVRFKKNRIIDILFDIGRIDLNRLAIMNFPREDHCQLAQLLGYSVGGYCDLSYVTPEEVAFFDQKAQDFVKSFNPQEYVQIGHPSNPVQPILMINDVQYYRRNEILFYLYQHGLIDLRDISNWLVSNIQVPAGYYFWQLQQLLGFQVGTEIKR